MVEVRCKDCHWSAYTVGSSTWYTSGSVTRYPNLYCDSCCGGSHSGWSYSGNIVKMQCKGCRNMIVPITWSGWNSQSPLYNGRCSSCRNKKLADIEAVKKSKEDAQRAKERHRQQQKQQQQQQQQNNQRLKDQERRHQQQIRQKEEEERRKERQRQEMEKERRERMELQQEKAERRHQQQMEQQKEQNAHNIQLLKQSQKQQAKQFETMLSKQQQSHQTQIQQNEENMRQQLKQQQQQQKIQHDQMLNQQKKIHKEQLKHNQQNMQQLKQQQKQQAIQHEKQIKLNKQSQQRLQKQILKVMDDRKEQQKAFELREEKIKQQLDAQINQVKAQNIKDQKLYEAKLKKLHDINDKKLKHLEEKRKKDRKLYAKDMQEIAAKNEQNMKTLKKNELKSRLNQIIQLAYVRLQQYKDKKEITLGVFAEYKKELLQIKLEERRLNEYFFMENNNPNIANIVLLGITGHGKSTLGCRLVGDKSEQCDSGLFRHTNCVSSETQLITKKVVQDLWKKDISITDTPGIYESSGAAKEREHLNNLIEFLRGCGGVNAFLLVKTRYPPRFEMTWKDTLATLEAMLGRAFWKHVIMVITHTKGKDSVQKNFDGYANSFRKRIYKDMDLKECEAKLPFVGVDSFENYKEPVKKLIEMIPSERFKCDELRSPLQELKLKNKNMQRKFNNLKQELNTIKQTIDLSNKQIYNANHLLSQHDDNYIPQFVDLSLIEKEAKDLWDINIVLPAQTKVKANILINNAEEKDEKDENDEKLSIQENKHQTNEPNWVPFKQIEYKYIAALKDDDVTLSFTDEDYNIIPWEIKLDSNHASYQTWINMLKKGVTEGYDVLVTINEVYYSNSADEQMIDIKRKIKNVKKIEY